MSMREHAFCAWINVHLDQAGDHPISDLAYDLRDGCKLITLLQQLHSCSLAREAGSSRTQALNNVNTVLQYLNDQQAAHVANVHANDVVDGSLAALSSLVWAIIQHSWKCSLANDDSMSDKNLSVFDALKRWTYKCLGDKVSDFSGCWADGTAFCALLQYYFADAHDNWASLVPLSVAERLEWVFHAAYDRAQITPMLSPNDFEGAVDAYAIMTCLIGWFHQLPHDKLDAEPEKFEQPPPIGELPSGGDLAQCSSSCADSREQLMMSDSDTGGFTSDSNKPPASKRKRTYSQSLKEYQACLEEVLAWLLEADEHLKAQLPVCETDVDMIKKQFKDHEEFMLRLTQSQDGVGKVLKRGQALARSGRMGHDSLGTIHKQIKLLNEKWESVRHAAMLRQNKLQDRLMYLQQDQLNNVVNWLKHQESGIENAEPVSSDPSIAAKQLTKIRDLQESIEQQQPQIYQLSSFVAVVDRNEQGEKSYKKFERQLQEVGKRWMVICQWAERRTARLDGLSDALRSLRKENDYFDDALLQHEQTLQQLRSAHHLTSQPEVVQQVSQLQELQMSMEYEQARFVRLSQLSSLVIARLEPDNPSAAMDIRRRFESVTQRWDNIYTRMEEHSQILVRSGKAESRQFRPSRHLSSASSSSPPPEVSELQHQQRQHQQLESPPASVTSSTTSTTTVIAAPTQSTTSPNQHELDRFEAAYASMSAWLGKAEARLTLVEQRSSTKEQSYILRLLESDISNQTDQLAQLREAAQLLQRYTGTEVQERMQQLNYRWRQLQLLLAERQSDVQAEMEEHTFHHKLAQTESVIDELAAWVDSFDAGALHDVASVRVALRKCQDRLDVISREQGSVEALQAHVAKLGACAGGDDVMQGRAQHAHQQLAAFANKCESVADRISAALATLTASLDAAPEPTNEQALQIVTGWLNGVNDVLNLPGLYQLDQLPVMEAKLEQIKELQAQQRIHEDSFELLNSDEHVAGIAQDQLRAVRQRWREIAGELSSAHDRLSEGHSQLQRWQQQVGSVNDCLDNCHVTLVDAQQHDGHKQSVVASMSEQIAQLHELRERASQLRQAGSGSGASAALCEQMDAKLAELAAATEHMTRAACAATNAQTNNTTESSASASAAAAEIRSYVAQANGKLDAISTESLPAPASGRDLQLLVKRLKTELSECESTCARCVEYLKSGAAVAAGDAELLPLLTGTLNAAQAKSAALRQAQHKYANAFEQWRQLQELLAAEKVAVDALDKQLAATERTVGDAEDYSEQLDTVERLMADTSSNERRIAELKASLLQEDILSEAVSNECGRVESLKQNTNKKASVVHEDLERSVAASNEFETRLAQSESWMSHVDAILESRADADVAASDLPDEYKQLQAEFEEYDKYLAVMKTRHAEALQKAPDAEATQRLRQQVERVEAGYAKLSKKFDEFKRPRDFEQRLSRVSRAFASVDQQLSGDGSSATPDLDKKIGELDAQIADLKATSERLSGERMLVDAEHTAACIQQLCEQSDRLKHKLAEKKESQADEQQARARVDTAVRSLDAFIDGLDAKVNKWQQSEPSDQIDADINFIEQLQMELTRQAAEFAQLDAAVADWQRLANSHETLPAVTALHDRRGRLVNALNKWSHSLMNMQKDNDSLEVEFERLVVDVGSWMTECDRRASCVAPDDVHAAKALQLEQSDMRLKVEQLRDKAIELSARDPMYQAKVQPHLTDVNTHWEKVQRTLQTLVQSTTAAAAKSANQQQQQQQEQQSQPTASASATAPVESSTSLSVQLRDEASKHAVEVVAVTDGPANYAQTNSQAYASSTITKSINDELQKCSVVLDGVERELDYDTKPVGSIDDWQHRHQAASAGLAGIDGDWRRVLQRGHELANSGPMELNVQHTLELIDTVNVKYNRLHKALTEQTERLANAVQQRAQHVQQTQQLRQRLQQLMADADNGDEQQRATVAAELRVWQQQFDSARAQQQQLLPLQADHASGAGDLSSDLSDLLERKQLIERKLRSVSPQDQQQLHQQQQQPQQQPQQQQLQQQQQQSTVAATIATTNTSPTETATAKLGGSETTKSESAAAPNLAEPTRRSSKESKSASPTKPPSPTKHQQRQPAPPQFVRPSSAGSNSGGMQHRASASPKRTPPASPTGGGQQQRTDLDAQIASMMPTVSVAIETVQTVKQLESSLKEVEKGLLAEQRYEQASGGYVNFSQQEDTLKALDSNLNAAELVLGTLKTAVHKIPDADTAENDRERLNLLLSSVQTRVSRLKEAKAQRMAAFQSRQANWQQFQIEIDNLQKFVAAEREKLAGQQLMASTSTEDVEKTQMQLERVVAEQQEHVDQIRWQAQQMTPLLAAPEGHVVKQQLDAALAQWNALRKLLTDRRELLEHRLADDSELRDRIAEISFWCDETESLLACGCDPTAKPALQELSDKCQINLSQYAQRQNELRAVEIAKEKYLNLGCVPTANKHQLRRDLAECTTRFAKLKPELSKRAAVLLDRLTSCKRFWVLMSDLGSWAQETRAQLDEYSNAKIYTPTRFDPNELVAEMTARRPQLEELGEMWEQMAERCKTETESGRVAEDTEQLYRAVVSDVQAIRKLATKIPSPKPQKKAGQPQTATAQQPKVNGHHPDTTHEDSETASKVSGEATTVDEEEQIKEMNLQKEEQKRKRAAAAADHHPTQLDPQQQQLLESMQADASKTPQPYAHLTPKGQEAMRQLVHLKHWLHDTQRENDKQIDLVDLNAIKQAVKAQQTFLDQLQQKRLQLIRILEDSREADVQHKAELVSHEWERATVGVNKRKRQLAHMTEDSREWDLVRTQLNMWLTEGKRCTVDASKTKDLSTDQLHKELADVKSFIEDLDVYKEKMHELNQRANQLLDKYPEDDATALSHTASELNTLWTKFNDNVRIRRAVLEASIRSRKDLHTALVEFEDWQTHMIDLVMQLAADTDNPQSVKDAHKRKAWIDREKEVRHEIEAHADVLASIREMATKLMDSMEHNTTERAAMAHRMDALNHTWNNICHNAGIVRERLESAQDEWERLTTALKELIWWTDEQDKAILQQSPVGGDLEHVSDQMQFIQQLAHSIEQKQAQVEDTIKLTHSYLVQQDLRQPPGDQMAQSVDPESTVARESRRMAQRLKVESDTLTIKWQTLNEKSQRWHKIIEEALAQFMTYDKAVQECDLNLLKMENSKAAWKPVKDVQLDDLPRQMADAKSFKHRLVSARTYVDDVNDQCARLLADNVQLSPAASRVLHALNKRYKQLDSAAAQRVHAVEAALNDFGPSSQHFLMASVVHPWERAISANRVPYFINHETEKTSWDHPKITDLMNKLCEFNEVKFSAYRTGMKLRALQKRLFFDLLHLSDLSRMLDVAGLKGCNDRCLDVSEIVMLLLPIYESIQSAHPLLLKSLPLAIDCCLNFLLNVYDPARSGTIRVLSLKVVMSLLCCADLEDKYKYLFHLTATDSGLDQKKLALLLWDAVQLPKFLGEVAAFGGTNVEPSVRSCFQRVQYPHTINQEQYLDWLKCEPQSLVWLPVMHRVAASETCKHQAKCNVCKMFPILGMRYRCLKCFNFDMCQNCFFSQRAAKGHKPIHPMKEYCVATTSGEDLKDFGRVIRNKLVRSRSKSPQIGYLPLQSVAEGATIETTGTAPSNVKTEHVHNRLYAMADRLHNADASTSTEATPTTTLPNGVIVADDSPAAAAAVRSTSPTVHPGEPPSNVHVPQSPAQIVRTIDHMQKEELDNLMHQLEEENRQLQLEYERLRGNMGGGGQGLQSAASTPQLPLTNGSLPRQPSRDDTPHSATLSGGYHRSMGQLPPAAPSIAPGLSTAQQPLSANDMLSEEDLLAEARALRLHKQRLEQRSKVLEEHNQQLDAQLQRLKRLIHQQQDGSTVGSPTPLRQQQQQQQEGTPSMGSVAPSSVASGTPARHTFHISAANAHHHDDAASARADSASGEATVAHMESLMHTAADLGRAMGNYVSTAIAVDPSDYSDRD